MEKNKEKHYLTVFTELDLFPRIRACGEDDLLSSEEKIKEKEEIKDAFIRECIKRFKNLSEEEIRKHVEFVLNKTINNYTKKEKDDIER